MVVGRMKLLPVEAKKIGSDPNSGQFSIRRTTKSHRNCALTLFSVLLITLHDDKLRRLSEFFESIG
jgi:hypothetical protein